jgi:hypothetical protein
VANLIEKFRCAVLCNTVCVSLCEQVRVILEAMKELKMRSRVELLIGVRWRSAAFGGDK